MKHDRSNKGSAAAFEKGCVRDTVKVSHGHWQRQQWSSPCSRSIPKAKAGAGYYRPFEFTSAPIPTLQVQKVA
jgi:hypothetical protein